MFLILFSSFGVSCLCWYCVCVCVCRGGRVRVCVEIQSLLGMLRHGMGSFLVFVGLDGTKEELNIVSKNFWMYKGNDLDSLYVCSCMFYSF